MHAYLIVGSSPKIRRKEAKKLLSRKGAQEVIVLESPKNKHLIKDIRGLAKKLSLKSPKRRGIMVENAHLLTTEAANSFLKTLEEPAGDTIIILTAPNPDLILGTVSSRTHIVSLGPAIYELDEVEKKQAEETLRQLLGFKTGERIAFAEEIGDRGQATSFVVGQIFAARELLLKTPSQNLVSFVERLEQTRQDLEANVNVKLAISELLLHYPKI